MSRHRSHLGASSLLPLATAIALCLAAPAYAQSKDPIKIGVIAEVQSIAGAATPGVRPLAYERTSGLGASAEAMVPIDQIVGTVEPTRCFDRRFRPTSEAPRTRFERIAVGIRSGMTVLDLCCGGRQLVSG